MIGYYVCLLCQGALVGLLASRAIDNMSTGILVIGINACLAQGIRHL